MCSMPSNVHMLLLSSLQNSLPWSVMTSLGTPCTKIQSFTIAAATVCAVLSLMATSLVTLVNAQVTTRMYFLEPSLALRGPKRSQWILSLGFVGSVNDFNGYGASTVLFVSWHGRHLAMYSSISASIFGQ